MSLPLTAERAGLLLIDKPTGMTSHDVVAQVRRVLGQKSVGHTGTLDPLATGLMVVVLGEATKLSDYLTMADKSYRVWVRFGRTTNTLDRTGEILTETPCDLAPEAVTQAALSLQGDFIWPVPLFSAAKIKGKKLYEYGREQVDVVLPVKTMSFQNVTVEEVASDRLQASLDCSKGSFIRTWADQLGMKLGVGGVMDELRRLRVGQFSVADALTLDELSEKCRTSQDLGLAFRPISQALPNWRSLMASPREARLMANGQVPRDLVNRLIVEQKQAHDLGSPVFVKVMTFTGDLLAILAAEPGQGLKIRRVFRSFT